MNSLVGAVTDNENANTGRVKQSLGDLDGKFNASGPLQKTRAKINAVRKSDFYQEGKAAAGVMGNVVGNVTAKIVGGMGKLSRMVNSLTSFLLGDHVNGSSHGSRYDRHDPRFRDMRKPRENQFQADANALGAENVAAIEQAGQKGQQAYDAKEGNKDLEAAKTIAQLMLAYKGKTQTPPTKEFDEKESQQPELEMAERTR